MSQGNVWKVKRLIHLNDKPEHRLAQRCPGSNHIDAQKQRGGGAAALVEEVFGVDNLFQLKTTKRRDMWNV